MALMLLVNKTLIVISLRREQHMKKIIAGLALLVFVAIAHPVFSMPMVFTGVYPMDASLVPAPTAIDSFNADLLNNMDEWQPAQASIIGLPSFMHVRHSENTPHFSTRHDRFGLVGLRGSGAAGKAEAPELQDLSTMFFLGIGLLSLGSLGKRTV
jgi:hypothetical protein